VAVCHHFQTNAVMNSATKKLTGWDEFIKNNPARINAGKMSRIKK